MEKANMPTSNVINKAASGTTVRRFSVRLREYFMSVS